MRKPLTFILVGLFAILIFALLAGWLALWMVSPGRTAPFVNDQGDVRLGSVAEILDLSLGGVSQFVLIRGRDVSNPILLILHGGPGDPAAPSFGAFNRSLEDHFVVVHWDQRGAGRSYSESIPDETMTVAQLVADTRELTLYLKARFSKEKILLAGHSWGSYLGMRVVHRYPEEYFAFVGIGQVANQQESEARSFEHVLAHAIHTGHVKAQRELEELGPPERGRYRGGLAGLGRQRKWVREFGGAAYRRDNLGALWMFVRPLLLFREYRVSDKLGFLVGEAYSMERLEEPMLDDDLTQTAVELQIPVFILQGRHDLQTVFDVARSYFDQLRAPLKEFIIFEDSAHLVPFEEPEKFLRVLVEDVCPLAL